MALSRTLVHASEGTGDQTDGNSHDGTQSLGTLAVDDLIIVHVAGTTGTSASNPPTWTAPAKDSGTATIGTVTEIAEAEVSNDFRSSVKAWWFKVTGAGTLTISYGDTEQSYGCGLIVLKYTGYDATTPVTGAVTNTRNGNNLNLTNSTLAATPTADDEVIQVVNWDVDASTGKGISVASGWTEVGSSFIGTASEYVMAHAAYDSTTSTTVAWSTENSTPTTYSVAGVAYIVQVATGGDQNITPTGPTVTAAGTVTVTTTVDVAPTGPTVTAAAGTATITTSTPIAPTGPTVTAAGTVVVTVGSVSITPTGPTVTAAAGTATITSGTPITPTGPTVTATAGTATITTTVDVAPTGPTVTAAGTVTVTTSTPVAPTGPTVTAAAGTVTVTTSTPITPDPVTVSAAGTVVVTQPGAGTQNVTPAAPGVSATAGTVTITTTVPVAPTGPTVAVAGTVVVTTSTPIAPTGPTVTSSAGTAVVTVGAVNVLPDSGFDGGFDNGFGQGTTVTVSAGTVTISEAVLLRPARFTPALPIDRFNEAALIDTFAPAAEIDTLAAVELVDA